MIDNPLVSIIIPVYNGANFMRKAIDSALAQTYKNIEIIVVNDGSNDNGQTDAIALSYGERIRYFVKSNGGVSSALNFGIERMRGEYFSWLSHDDVYELNKVERQVESLKYVDDHTLICCKCSYIDEESKVITGYFPKNGFRHGVYNWQESLRSMLEKATLNGCCLLIPKDALENHEGFDESLRFCQDVFMWYNVFLSGYSLYYTEEILVRSRVHKNQLTQTEQKLFRKECCMISDYLMNAFVKASSIQYNFIKMYLISDSMHLPIQKVRKIIDIGKQNGLISYTTEIKAYFICGYGKIRPLLRKIYYRLFRGIKSQ